MLNQKQILIIEPSQQDFNFFQKIVTYDAARKKIGLKLIRFDDYQIALKKINQIDASQNPIGLIFFNAENINCHTVIQAINEIWHKSQNIEVVVYSQVIKFNWENFINHLDYPSQIVFLKKPFIPVEVRQITQSFLNRFHENYKEASAAGSKKSLKKQPLQSFINNALAEDPPVRASISLKNEHPGKTSPLYEKTKVDDLTNLLNHNAFYEHFTSILNEAKKQHFPVALMILDINFFKEIIKKHGPSSGDELLIKTSELLKSELRVYDIKIHCINDNKKISFNESFKDLNLKCNYGGDEFILILPYCNSIQAKLIGNRLIEAAKKIDLQKSNQISLSFSIGIAALERNKVCHDNDLLIQLADKALYEAMGKGKNHICLYNYCSE